jgi:hypothetical protein
MSDKLPACQWLTESPFAGSLDKPEACRTLRVALSFFQDAATGLKGLQKKSHEKRWCSFG